MKKIARYYKALSEETRLRIVMLLIEGGELCVCDIVAVLEMPQSTVSRHLAYLRDAGLLTDTRKGVWMYYKIRDDQLAVQNIINSLQELVTENHRSSADRHKLAEYLASKDADACSNKK